MFLLYYDAKTKKVSALNGSGRAPKSLTIAGLRKKGIMGDSIPMDNINAATVPGAPAGWLTTLEKFGNKTVSIAEILAPAIQLAEDGFLVSELTAYPWKATRSISGEPISSSDTVYFSVTNVGILDVLVSRLSGLSI